MGKAVRHIQFLANIATILIAILFSIVVAKQYLITNSRSEILTTKQTNLLYSESSDTSVQTQLNPIGQRISLPNVDWNKNNKTLILYISSTCHFCTKSSLFYQHLLEKVSSKDVKFIAVLPQPIDQGHDYLKKLNVNIDTVLQGSFQSIGVRSTPTLLLVNNVGVITEFWKGKLPTEKEDEVIAKLKE